MSFAAAIQRDTELQASQSRPCTFREVTDVITFLRDSSSKPSPPFALDMFAQEAATITPELRARVPSMRSETKAKFLLRLSLWTRSNNSRPSNTESFDITEIKDGTEKYVTRVTGAKLYEDTAQGNASRVQAVVYVEALFLGSTDTREALVPTEPSATTHVRAPMDIDGGTNATAANALSNDDCKDPTTCPSSDDAVTAADGSNGAILDGPNVDDGQVGAASSSNSVGTKSDSSSKTDWQLSDGQQPATEMVSVTESGGGRNMSFQSPKRRGCDAVDDAKAPFQSPKKRVALKEKVPFMKSKKA